MKESFSGISLEFLQVILTLACIALLIQLLYLVYIHRKFHKLVNRYSRLWSSLGRAEKEYFLLVLSKTDIPQNLSQMSALELDHLFFQLILKIQKKPKNISRK